MIPIENDALYGTHKLGILNEIIDEIYDPESSLIENLLLCPLYTCGLIFVCYLDNPLMKTILKFLLLSSSIIFAFLALGFGLKIWITLIIGLSIGFICLILELVKVP